MQHASSTQIALQPFKFAHSAGEPRNAHAIQLFQALKLQFPILKFLSKGSCLFLRLCS